MSDCASLFERLLDIFSSGDVACYIVQRDAKNEVCGKTTTQTLNKRLQVQYHIDLCMTDAMLGEN